MILMVSAPFCSVILLKKVVSFGISGMHCKNCEKTVKERLLGIPGIEEAEVSFAEEKATVVFDPDKISLDEIGEELLELGYEMDRSKKGNSSKGSGAGPPPKQGKTSLKAGIVYGLVPHIGCIGFIVASILGVTIAVEFFKPLLMNPWFFHILIIISIGFATLSSAFYLRKNGILSLAGIKRKKKYLATMYGSTVGINLVLFLLVFPLLANLDTGSFAEHPTGAVALAGTDAQNLGNSLLALQVNIPCPGHAPLISGELKTIEGVTGVRYSFPSQFDVAFDSGKTSKQEILSLEVFETYPATVVDESGALEQDSVALEGIKEVEANTPENSQSVGSCGGSCGGNCGGCGCGAR